MSTVEVQKTDPATQVENLHAVQLAVSHFKTKHLVLWTLDPRLWNHIEGTLKKTQYEFKVGYTHKKSNYPVSNTFMSFYVSPIGANSDKRKWSCDEGLDREPFDLFDNEL